jgi:hypothetical protein
MEWECYPLLQKVYMAPIIIVSSVLLPVITSARFASPVYSKYRALAFGGLVSWGVVPLLHSLYIYDAAFHAVGYLFWMEILCYLTGTCR